MLLVDDLQDPSIIFIVEIKGTRNTVGSSSWKYGFTQQGGDQMSDSWIEYVRDNLMNNRPEVQNLLFKIDDPNIAFRKAGIFVDGNGIAYMLNF